MFKFIIIPLVFFTLSTSKDNWAVLVAGSNGYGNYRHQSDVFHGYQILIKNGIPANRIITFAYDDIRFDKRNPTPGVMCNKPNGPDVCAGVVIDYSGKDCTSTNFLAVIRGEKDKVSGGSGRVLESAPEDNIFIYFNGIGATRILAFPVGRDLYADDLNNALTYMWENKRFNKMLFYLDSCYSGSMFEGLLSPGENIYVNTASNAHESSYAYYCGDEAKCGGKRVSSCLGDEFSVSWMEIIESIDIWITTVGEVHEKIKSMTKGSHIMEYGDLSIKEMIEGEFVGHKASKMYKFLNFVSGEEKEDSRIVIPNVDYYIYYLKKIAEDTNEKAAWENYKKEMKLSSRSKYVFFSFKKKFGLPEMTPINEVDMKCLKSLKNFYNASCGFNIERDAKYAKYLASYCSTELPLKNAYLFLEEICA